MAIKRCPYCKAIIDGVAAYCSNCGTQLLFPEDESKEEEIPGDKIVEEEEEEDEETPPQGKEVDVKTVEAKRMQETQEWVKKETQRIWDSVMMEGEEKAPTPEEKREEVSESVEIEFPEMQAEEIRTEEEPLQEKEVKEETGEPPSSKATEKEEAPESKEELPPEKEKEEKEETPPQKEEIDFRTLGLKRTPDTEEREKEEIEKFVKSIKEKRGEEARTSEEEIPPSAEREKEEKEEEKETPPQKEEIDFRSLRLRKTPDTEEREKEEIEKFVKSIKEKREEKEKEALTPEEKTAPTPEGVKEKTSEVEEGIPPWVEKIKEVPPPELEEIEGEIEKEKPIELGEDFQEKEKKPPEDEHLPSVKEVGLPEEVEQKGLPFGREIEVAKKRARVRRRLRFSARLRSRAFDILFMTAFCFVCLGLASRLMEVSLFKLIYVSAFPVLIFYMILLMFYFVFFIFFLGETPGDRIFPRE